MSMQPPSPWIPEADPIRLAVLGKFAEELAECTEAAVLVSMMGPDCTDPETGKRYVDSLHEEIADVLSGVRLVTNEFGIDFRFSLHPVSPDVPRTLAHKVLLEELARSLALVAAQCNVVVARCIIQGVDGAHPVTGRTNCDWLTRALEDIVALFLRILALGFDCDAIEKRIAEKIAHKKAWHDLIRQHASTKTAGIEDFRVVCDEPQSGAPIDQSRLRVELSDVLTARKCECDQPVVKCGDNGCRCTTCGNIF